MGNATNHPQDPVADRILELWNAGKTAGEIGRTINHAKTRNAILGIVHRARLRGERVRGAEPARAKPARSPQAPRSKPKPEKPADIAEPEFDALIAVANEDLLTSHCKWPVGDPATPEFRFCGRQRVEGKPYCEGHLGTARGKERPRQAYVEPKRASIYA